MQQQELQHPHFGQSAGHTELQELCGQLKAEATRQLAALVAHVRAEADEQLTAIVAQADVQLAQADKRFQELVHQMQRQHLGGIGKLASSAPSARRACSARAPPGSVAVRRSEPQAQAQSLAAALPPHQRRPRSTRGAVKTLDAFALSPAKAQREDGAAAASASPMSGVAADFRFWEGPQVPPSPNKPEVVVELPLSS